MDYLIRLDDYEGPLDRLLRLVEKQEIDAVSIPVYKVIQQIADCLETVSYADIDEGGRFLVLAATLLAIKAQLLLPRKEAAAGEDGAFWDGDDLAERFNMSADNEYLSIKEAARTLEEYARNWVLSHRRPALQEAGMSVEPEIRDDISRLVSAFREILDRTVFEPAAYQVEMAVDFEAKVDAVFARIAAARGGLPLSGLFVNTGRLEAIYSFLAVLELVYRGRLRLSRRDNDAGIILVAVRKKR